MLTISEPGRETQGLGISLIQAVAAQARTLDDGNNHGQYQPDELSAIRPSVNTSIHRYIYVSTRLPSHDLFFIYQ